MHKLNSNLLTFLNLSIYMHVVVIHTNLPSYAIYFHFHDWFFFHIYCFQCTEVKRQDLFIGYFVSCRSIFMPKLLGREKNLSSSPFELLPAYALPLRSHSVL